MMSNEISPQLVQAVAEQNGGPVYVDTGGSSLVVMSLAAFRNLVGLESNHDLANSVAAVRRGLMDIDSGRTRPLREALDDLGRNHDLPR